MIPEPRGGCYLKDVNFDRNGRPVILFLTSRASSPVSQRPRQWQTFRWNGRDWVRRPFTTSATTTTTARSISNPTAPGRVIAPTELGRSPTTRRREMVMWTSTDEGQTWTRVKQLTRNSPRNHTYARRPLNAHPTSTPVGPTAMVVSRPNPACTSPANEATTLAFARQDGRRFRLACHRGRIGPVVYEE